MLAIQRKLRATDDQRDVMHLHEAVLDVLSDAARGNSPTQAEIWARELHQRQALLLSTDAQLIYQAANIVVEATIMLVDWDYLRGEVLPDENPQAVKDCGILVGHLARRPGQDSSAAVW